MELLLIQSIRFFFELLNLLIFVRVIMSWFPQNNSNKWMILLYQLTDPVLEPFKRLSNRFGFNFGMMDLSPIIALLFLQVIAEPLVIYIIKMIF